MNRNKGFLDRGVRNCRPSAVLGGAGGAGGVHLRCREEKEGEGE